MCTPGERIEVLLSERNPEPNRSSRALPLNGLLGGVAIRGRARRNPIEGSRASLLTGAQFAPAQPEEPGLDPLYLFACGLSWRRQADINAGWELVRCLKSPGQTSRIAASLLSLAADTKPPTRALVRAIDVRASDVHGIITVRKPCLQSKPLSPGSGRLGRR